MADEETLQLLTKVINATVHLGLAQARSLMALSNALKLEVNLSDETREASERAFEEVKEMLDALDSLNEISQEVLEVAKRER